MHQLSTGWYPLPDELAKLPDSTLLSLHAEISKSVSRLWFSLLGFATFCLVSLESPDSLLIGESATINLPFVGQIPFTGFLFMGPVILIGLRLYLHLLVTHQRRVEIQIVDRALEPWPTPAPRRHPFMKTLAGLALYVVVPLTMLDFTWKALALPSYGAAMAVTTALALWAHLALAIGMRGPVRISVSLVAAAALVVVCYPIVREPDDFKRPFVLFRADLSGAYLAKVDLRHAKAGRANFDGAILVEADMRGIQLSNATLRGADLTRAKLTGAQILFSDGAGALFDNALMHSARVAETDLSDASLIAADLRDAHLLNVNFERANLNAANLKGADISNSVFTDAIVMEANLEGVTAEGIFQRRSLENAIGLSDLQRQQLARARRAQRRPLYDGEGNIIGYDEDVKQPVPEPAPDEPVEERFDSDESAPTSKWGVSGDQGIPQTR